ncbi:hypothetical protein JAAARDRAFT_81333 [Jaapia argillacea MUCL 33604]|uniref:Uncharacterized protein n=1 Tax=Jaapia argillacea MUCL 33604 TaxID=933084 RepID=A0A067PL97_9AGAM|nr:hypothetical protein JAAARDRAFT_81333 [Jaapia argillacea MUCL 33604]
MSSFKWSDIRMSMMTARQGYSKGTYDYRYPHFSILDLPSAREHRLPNRASVRSFIQWAKSEEARRDDISGLRIKEIHWMKQAGFPAHEYLILVVSEINDVPSPVTFLRIERDTDSWSTLWRPTSKSNCKDTVTLSNSRRSIWGDDALVSKVVSAGSDLDISKLVCLLEAITDSADAYNLWTLNCWWFAGCIWSNLVEAARLEPMFEVEKEMSQEMTAFCQDLNGEVDPIIWDARKFAKIQQFVHLSALKRTFGDSQSRGEVESISVLIQRTYQKPLRSIESLGSTPNLLPDQLVTSRGHSRYSQPEISEGRRAVKFVLDGPGNI